MQNQVKINWTNAIFLWSMVFISLVVVPIYLVYNPVNWSIVAFAVFYTFFCGLGITAGYHRYFCHKSFKAHPLVEWFFLITGAANWQGPLSYWMSEHKYHHMYPETDKDPYTITKGFWFAHMGWLIRRQIPELIPEVISNKKIMWQHHNYYWVATLVGFVIPALVGYALGDWMQGLLLAGIARTCYSEQVTFFINSAGHSIGPQPNHNTTARNNWLLIVLTLGEGFHNNHHSHPSDYRHGPKWYHFDPTKWFLDGLSKLGLVYDKKTTHN